MAIWHGILLGMIQGFTEFLPVSSSGHLVISQSILSVEAPGALFEVVLHLGTALAIVLLFWKRIVHLTFREVMLLVMGSIPAGFVGVIFQSEIESVFENTLFVGGALLVTGVLNIAIDRLRPVRKNIQVPDALTIGIAQACAIIPGISRSGATIFAGTAQGITRKSAAEFSFLLSVPAIVGASGLQLLSHGGETSLNSGFMVSGFVSAFISGVIAITLVMKLLEIRKFYIFGIYAILLGVITILFLG